MDNAIEFVKSWTWDHAVALWREDAAGLSVIVVIAVIFGVVIADWLARVVGCTPSLRVGSVIHANLMHGGGFRVKFRVYPTGIMPRRLGSLRIVMLAAGTGYSPEIGTTDPLGWCLPRRGAVGCCELPVGHPWVESIVANTFGALHIVATVDGTSRTDLKPQCETPMVQITREP
jgi:hypothetical protein